ncbi:elongator complex protein 2 [Phymastichus coffea]|uniref:elongator complex protein 2 n=1 Tax=Phymastichus coffea TaxID=108790 RepID=UPI00273B43CC|nr:elongator complex protein 2 [Phymastichus coffea]
MIKTSYISCACNRLPHVVDWGRNNLVCYGANNSIAIYNPTANKFGKVLSTLHVHTDRVNTVRWIKPCFPNPETEFISASSDGTAIIWQLNDEATGSFKASDILRINEPTNICDAIYLTENSLDLLICTGSTDGDFRLWIRVGDQEIEPTQILSFSKKLPIGARLALMPNEPDGSLNPLLFIAMEDSSILLYSTIFHSDDLDQKKIGDFVKVQTLVGHEDWVTCIDYILTDSQELLIATGSQDSTIRLYKISRKSIASSEITTNDELKLKKQNFFLHDHEYEIVLESILCAHDSWIYEVHWHPLLKKDNKNCQPLKLLSCSLDKTAIIWEPSKNAGIWSETVRVGEVGGNSLGFYGCKFGPQGNSILTYGYHGSFHMWKFDENSQNWKPKPAPSGHFNSVVDLCWDSKGRFFISVSTDQTTRVHAPWLLDDGEESWHEIGRPQIHGYDMSCIAILKPNIFASGAEEKVVRIFTAPLSFKNYLEKLCNDIADFDINVKVEGASVPALGLTNKAVTDELSNDQVDQNKTENSLGKLNYNEPPVEEDIVRYTLWPELQKLYGHGYEIFSIAARYDGKVLATSSKSSCPEHAVIILWDTTAWHQPQKLFAHHLTVTQLAFSPDGQYLLSVSRDRRWALFALQDEKYELLVMSPKKDSLHARIIWCCAWTSDSKYFATGSRDGKIGIWSVDKLDSQQPTAITSLTLTHTSITAVAFAPLDNQDDELMYVIAMGFENGCIDIRKIKKTNESYSWLQIVHLNQSEAHHMTVKRITFRPMHKNQQKNKLQFASCGADNIIKVHDLLLN